MAYFSGGLWTISMGWLAEIISTFFKRDKTNKQRSQAETLANLRVIGDFCFTLLLTCTEHMTYCIFIFCTLYLPSKLHIWMVPSGFPMSDGRMSTSSLWKTGRRIIDLVYHPQRQGGNGNTDASINKPGKHLDGHFLHLCQTRTRTQQNASC